MSVFINALIFGVGVYVAAQRTLRAPPKKNNNHIPPIVAPTHVPTRNPIAQRNSRDRLRICICSNHTPEIYAYSKLAMKVNQAYADYHNYDFRVFTFKPMDRAPQWAKIHVLNELLAEGYEYVFWIDADAIFNRFEIRLESFIAQDPGKELYICDDSVNSGRKNTLNSGTMLIKNSNWSRNFFKQLWQYKGPYLYERCHEQVVMEQLFDASKIKVFPGDAFNSNFYELTLPSIYSKFIIHLMAWDNESRIIFLKNWLNAHQFA